MTRNTLTSSSSRCCKEVGRWTLCKSMVFLFRMTKLAQTLGKAYQTATSMSTVWESTPKRKILRAIITVKAITREPISLSHSSRCPLSTSARAKNKKLASLLSLMAISSKTIISSDKGNTTKRWTIWSTSTRGRTNKSAKTKLTRWLAGITRKRTRNLAPRTKSKST